MMRLVLWGRPLLEWVSDRLGRSVLALQVRPALAFSPTKNDTAMKIIRTRGRAWLQRDPDGYEGH